jgi:hypothetical protein
MMIKLSKMFLIALLLVLGSTISQALTLLEGENLVSRPGADPTGEIVLRGGTLTVSGWSEGSNPLKNLNWESGTLVLQDGSFLDTGVFPLHVQEGQTLVLRGGFYQKSDTLVLVEEGSLEMHGVRAAQSRIVVEACNPEHLVIDDCAFSVTEETGELISLDGGGLNLLNSRLLASTCALRLRPTAPVTVDSCLFQANYTDINVISGGEYISFKNCDILEGFQEDWGNNDDPENPVLLHDCFLSAGLTLPPGFQILGEQVPHFVPEVLATPVLSVLRESSGGELILAWSKSSLTVTGDPVFARWYAVFVGLEPYFRCSGNNLLYFQKSRVLQNVPFDDFLSNAYFKVKALTAIPEEFQR